MSLDFFGVPFSVELVEAKLTTLNMGESTFDQCTIRVQSDMPRPRQEQVMIHEIIHVLLDGEDDEPEIDEAFVRRMGNNLYEFLLANALLREGWFDRIVDHPDETKVVPINRARGKVKAE